LGAHAFILELGGVLLHTFDGRFRGELDIVRGLLRVSNFLVEILSEYFNLIPFNFELFVRLGA
jgi:hypothetical protein